MSRWRDVARGGFRRGVFPHQFWFLLETPGRRWLQPPEQLAQRLHLSPNSRVLEIGPGSGFFSVAVAACIPEGHLALLDLQPEFLERARRKLASAGLHNFGCTPGNACGMPFPDRDFDVVMMVSVLGDSQPASGLHRELSPAGAACVESPYDPQAHKRSIQAVLAEEEPKDRQAPEPWNLRNTRRGREA